MKDAIILKLKARFPKLSDARIAAYAAKLESKIKDEKDIDDKITDLDDVVDFPSIIKLDEKLAKLELEKKEAKKKPVDKKDEPVVDPADDVDSDTTDHVVSKKEPKIPAWAKELIDSNKALNDKIAGIEAQKSQSTIEQKLTEKLKAIPKKYWAEWKRPEKDEDIDGFVTKVTEGHAGYMQDLKTEGYITSSIPKAGFGVAGDKATPEEIKNITDKIIK